MEYETIDIKARVLDILWIRNRNHTLGLMAAQEYFQLVKNILVDDVEKFELDISNRIIRASKLAYKFDRKDSGLFEEINDYIDTQLQTCTISHQGNLLHDLMQIRIGIKGAPHDMYISRTCEIIKYFKSKNRWDTVRKYCGLLVSLYRKLDDEENILKARTEYAETYIREVDLMEESINPSFIHISMKYTEAIQAYKKVEGSKSVRNKLQIRLESFQEKAMDQFSKISTTIPIGEIITPFIDNIPGNNKTEILMKLTSEIIIPEYEKIKRRAEIYLSKSITSKILPISLTSSKGKIISKTNPYLNENQSEKRLRLAMYREVNREIFTLGACIGAIIEDIQLYQNYTEKDFLSLVYENPFIPQGRELIYAKGLYFGIKGDFFTSVHLLVPQIENSLRYLLIQYGVPASTFSDQTLQLEHSLNTLLLMPEINKIIGADTVLTLRALLIEKIGSNVRNKISHGLEDYHGYELYPHMYTWWITLRILIYSKIAFNEGKKTFIYSE